MKESIGCKITEINVYSGYEEIDLLRGDINYDGILSQLDVNSILRYAIGIEAYSNVQYVIADMNGNGTIERRMHVH